ncbi:MAG: hypothetical protein JWP25_8040 [Bradyrhizobium sp.]|jgi:hypothetical protein|nr:hypothetical protein [Bradyrhizobium sp.]
MHISENDLDVEAAFKDHDSLVDSFSLNDLETSGPKKSYQLRPCK